MAAGVALAAPDAPADRSRAKLTEAPLPIPAQCGDGGQNVGDARGGRVPYPRMDPKYLGELERGWHAATIPTAKRIADALEATLAELVADL